MDVQVYTQVGDITLVRSSPITSLSQNRVLGVSALFPFRFGLALANELPASNIRSRLR